MFRATSELFYAMSKSNYDAASRILVQYPQLIGQLTDEDIHKLGLILGNYEMLIYPVHQYLSDNIHNCTLHRMITLMNICPVNSDIIQKYWDRYISFATPDIVQSIARFYQYKYFVTFPSLYTNIVMSDELKTLFAREDVVIL